jgi:NAD(P)-dependent dehydrogenase (short-subunit alcohol dehydrogenase family)
MTDARTRTVLITGASKGIGEACALHLDTLGFHVFAGVRRDEDARALAARGSTRLTPIRLDVTDSDQIAAALETIRGAVGPAGLDALVNNAGVALGGPLEFLPLAEIRGVFEVNLFGVVAVTQAFLPLLRQAHGRIVNVSSVSGRFATPFLGPYSASKFALEALSDAWRVELAHWGLKLVLIEPGATRTPIWETSLARAERLAEAYPPEAHALYGKVLARVSERTREIAARGVPVDRVARAVGRALTARRPRRRYPVGFDTRVGIALARWAPAWLRDRLTR